MALRVAIIGTGHLGTYHCEKMHQIPQVDLVAVCDTNMEKAQNLGHKYSCQALTNYQDLVSNQGSRVDAVVIAVPTSIHFQVAQFFIKKSISVLVEKPLCRTLEEARWLCEWASSASCILQVGHVERFNPAFKSVKSRLQEALFIETRRWTSFRPRSLDVDVVSDLMVHDLDLVLSLAESSVKSIWATGSAFRSSHLDQAWASIEFNSGLCAHLGVSRVSPVPRRSLEVFKKDESFLLDLAHSKVQWTPPRVQGSPPQTSLEKGCLFQEDQEVKDLPVPHGDALKEQDSSFVDCVLNSTTPLVSGPEGLKAMELVDQVLGDIQNRSLLEGSFSQ